MPHVTSDTLLGRINNADLHTSTQRRRDTETRTEKNAFPPPWAASADSVTGIGAKPTHRPVPLCLSLLSVSVAGTDDAVGEGGAEQDDPATREHIDRDGLVEKQISPEHAEGGNQICHGDCLCRPNA
jgi:hypothetical protein